MTDSRKLLAEYVKHGSESAFRALVSRYMNLVYSTALRLLGGDAYWAEDVAQTVFIGLASKGRTLRTEVRVGGWLHQHTYHVATKAVRAERRRQSREREAVEMNTLQNGSSADWQQVAPVLDEAITLLGKKDRTAILLRFFEQCDFRSVGEALGSNEDAARIRVNRALEKLHSVLKRRGVTLSVAGLGTMLMTEAVTAAPAGLAVSIAGTALACAVASGGITGALVKLMTMTKLTIGVVSVAAVVGVLVVFRIYFPSQGQLGANHGVTAGIRQAVVPSTPGPVSWWRGEGNALDAVGGNSGVLENGAGFGAGVVGQAFSFSASSNSYVEVADSPALELTNALTWECWAKRLNTSQVHTLVEKGGSWTGGQTEFESSLNDTYAGGAHFGFSCGSGWRGCAVTPDTAWHHYAAVAVSGQANPILYIDGVSQPIVFGGGSATMSFYPSTRALHIGGFLDPETGWFYYSDTLIDEPAIYNRALSAAEIQAIYKAGRAGKGPWRG